MLIVVDDVEVRETVVTGKYAAVPDTGYTETRESIAAKRGWQTFGDGVLVVVVFAVVMQLGGVIGGASSWDALFGSWRVWTWGVMQAVAVAFVAWFQRRYKDHAGFSTGEGSRGQM